MKYGGSSSAVFDDEIEKNVPEEIALELNPNFQMPFRSGSSRRAHKRRLDCFIIKNSAGGSENEIP
ncbi:MAG: hypothetical protein HYZ51_01250 [Candidatus Doudnabacteria bacterium]|nr:hypothetical protein [Candidatus Doudnabacteria bacterium]